MNFEARGRRSEAVNPRFGICPPTSDFRVLPSALCPLTSDFLSIPIVSHTPPMFDNVKTSVGTATQKLTHLRRFL